MHFRFRLAAVAILATGVPVLLGIAPASAKLRADEKAGLVSIMHEVGDGATPPASVVTCAANRLPAGTIDGVIADGAAAGAPAELANSIPFRRIMKAILVCRLPALVNSVATAIDTSVFTRTQRSCLANGMVLQMGVDESLLTITIRSGLNGVEFSDLGAADRALVAERLAPAIRKCVPARLADLAIAEILDAA